jgi:hypothetical protein
VDADVRRDERRSSVPDVLRTLFRHELGLGMRGQLMESRVCRTYEGVLAWQERWRGGSESEEPVKRSRRNHERGPDGKEV